MNFNLGFKEENERERKILRRTNEAHAIEIEEEMELINDFSLNFHLA